MKLWILFTAVNYLLPDLNSGSKLYPKVFKYCPVVLGRVLFVSFFAILPVGTTTMELKGGIKI